MISVQILDLSRTTDHFNQLHRLNSPILLEIFNFIFDSHFCISEAILRLHLRQLSESVLREQINHIFIAHFLLSWREIEVM